MFRSTPHAATVMPVCSAHFELFRFCNQVSISGIQNIDMTRKIDIDRMRVASPCHIGWDSMTGDYRARLCGSCDRHVYNIVGLTRFEIESLVENTEGRLCVRMYQRPDATVVTEDCPVGLRLIRKRAATFAGAALSALLGLVSVGFGQDSSDQPRSNVRVERVKIDSGWSEISGIVTDASGAVVPGVEVLLKGLGFDKQAKTDADGIFRFESLRPDLRYELSIELEGFTKYRITNLDPTMGEDLTVKVSMQPGSPPYVPVEQNLSPVVPIESPSISSNVWTQPTDSCSPSGAKMEGATIDSKNGQISGSITDQMGAVVAGITVRLLQNKTLVSFVTSDAAGRFEIKNILPGTNHLLTMADHPWKEQKIEGITINAGEKVDYSVCLEVGAHTEVVGIFVEGPDMLFAEPTQPAETFVPRQIYLLPGKVKELLSTPRLVPKQPD